MATIETTFLGLALQSPIIVGSSSLTGQARTIAELAKAGAGAVVLKSLFEEQILNEAAREAGRGGVVYGHDDLDGFVSYYTKKHSISEYIGLIKASKAASPIPVIASINAISNGEWKSIASEIAAAGADALQLNLFVNPFDENRSADQLEALYTDIVRSVKAVCSIPLAAKIGPYFTAIPRMVRALAQAGADSVILFNRYQSPDIDIDKLAFHTAPAISSAGEYVQALRWVSLVSGSAGVPVIGATGIHDDQALIKMLLAGSPAVEVVSTVLRNGHKQIGAMNKGLSDWMDAHGYTSIAAFRGAMAGKAPADRASLERFQYIKTFGDAN